MGMVMRQEQRQQQGKEQPREVSDLPISEC